MWLSTSPRTAAASAADGAPGEITTLRRFHHGKTRLVRVNGPSRASTATGLEFSKNMIWIPPVSKYGTVFPAQRVKFTRK